MNIYEDVATCIYIAEQVSLSCVVSLCVHCDRIYVAVDVSFEHQQNWQSIIKQLRGYHRELIYPGEKPHVEYGCSCNGTTMWEGTLYRRPSECRP
jgi:hypothetical protein